MKNTTWITLTADDKINGRTKKHIRKWKNIYFKITLHYKKFCDFIKEIYKDINILIMNISIIYIKNWINVFSHFNIQYISFFYYFRPS